MLSYGLLEYKNLIGHHQTSLVTNRNPYKPFNAFLRKRPVHAILISKRYEATGPWPWNHKNQKYDYYNVSGSYILSAIIPLEELYPKTQLKIFLLLSVNDVIFLFRLSSYINYTQNSLPVIHW